MALMDQLRSRLKGTKKAETTVPAPETPEQTAGSERASTPEIPPPREPAELRLPPEHPLLQLRELYAAQTGEAQPPPCLSLEPLLMQCLAGDGPVRAPNGEPLVPLTEEEAEQELKRLRELVDKTAAKRLEEFQERLAIAAARAAELAARQAKPGEAPPPPPSPDQLPPPDTDADIHVFLSTRKMAAWLLIYPPSGKGLQVSKKMVERTLEAAQVISGIDEKKLHSLSGSPDRYFTLHLIAVGRMPLHGRDGSVIDLFPRERVHNLKEDENGRVDFASLELFHNVHEGEMICRISYPTEPADGKTVQGQVLPGRPGRPPEVPMGRNTQFSEDKGSLIASCDGHVEFGGRTFQVKPVLDIAGSVDFSVGNISSVGDVHIHGDVRGGFTVKATGSITVDGVVEGSSVEAGGDLMVRKGVQGSGRAVLRAGRDVYVKYMESTVVFVRGNLEADSMMSCKVYCDGQVTARSGRGAVMGGEIHAAQGVSASIVGTPSELTTAIFLGGRPYEEFQRTELAQSIDALEADLDRLDRQPDSPAKLQRMGKVRMLIAANKLKLRQLDKELERPDAAPGASKPAGRLSCGVLHPGVEITIGVYFLRVAHETRSCMTSVSEDGIVLI